MPHLYSYLTFNIILGIAYFITRHLLGIPLCKKFFSQQFQLYFARYSIIICIAIFTLWPFIKEIFPVNDYVSLQILHTARSTSEEALHFQPLLQPNNITTSYIYDNLSIEDLFVPLILIGISISVFRHIKSMHQLKSLVRKSFCKHKIRNIHVLFNNEIATPFCWSTFSKHFIMLPMDQTHQHLKMSLRHELQHIRQHDGHWLYFLNLLKVIIFWNPAIYLWINHINEHQEFSCDEAITLKHQPTSIDYAECLSQIATQMYSRNLLSNTTIGISGIKKSILFRRINMIFNYRKIKNKMIIASIAYALSIFTTTSTVFALESADLSPLSRDQLSKIISDSKLDSRFEITATPELVNEINKIRSNNESREALSLTLQRMQPYQTDFTQALEKSKLPTDLLAIPFIESGYQQLTPEVNPVQAAGIWQIVPATGKKYGLRVDANNDERMNPTLATQAAINYLTKLHDQFGSWKLAVIAYEYGENQIEQLIDTGHSRNAWTLASSTDAPKNLKEFITKFDAAVVIMHNPTIIQG